MNKVKEFIKKILAWIMEKSSKVVVIVLDGASKVVDGASKVVRYFDATTKELGNLNEAFHKLFTTVYTEFDEYLKALLKNKKASGFLAACVLVPVAIVIVKNYI